MTSCHIISAATHSPGRCICDMILWQVATILVLIALILVLGALAVVLAWIVDWLAKI